MLHHHQEMLVNKEEVLPEDGVKTENSVKTEDVKTLDNVHHTYFDDECKNLIINLFKYILIDGYLRQPNFDNWYLILANTVNVYLEKKSWCGQYVV